MSVSNNAHTFKGRENEVATPYVRQTTVQGVLMEGNIGIEDAILVTELAEYSKKESIDVAPYQKDFVSSHEAVSNQHDEFLS